MNEGKSSFEADTVRARGVLRSLGFEKKLAAKKWRETQFLSNEEKENWIEDYVQRESAGARKRVEDAESVIKQDQEDTRMAESAGLTTREPEMTCLEMIIAIWDCLTNLARSDDGEDREDEDDEETVQGKLSEDDEPGCVMGTIPKMVQPRMDRFRQKKMKLDELTQLG